MQTDAMRRPQVGSPEPTISEMAGLPSLSNDLGPVLPRRIRFWLRNARRLPSEAYTLSGVKRGIDPQSTFERLMKVNRAPEGLEVTISSSGFGRFITAAFIGVWLLFWTAGEGFAIWMLVKGIWAFLTGKPPGPGRGPISLDGALPVGLFLLLWLSLWTFGGFFAGRQFLRLLFGKDIIRAHAEGLDIVHSFGLFRSHKSVAREDIRRFYHQPRKGAFCVEADRGTIEVTQLGSPGDRDELEKLLRTEFMLREETALHAVLPGDWREVPSAEGESVLVKNPEMRSKQSLVMWIICLLVAAVTIYVVASLPEHPGLWAYALILAALAAGAAYGAAWLTFGRNEWILRTGQLVLQRRFRQRRTFRFEAVSLELYEDNSGDSGPSYALNAVAANAPPLSVSVKTGKQRRRIWARGSDPTEPRNLGRWLSERCQIPFDDQTTIEAKEKQFEAWKTKLASAGPLGKAVGRWMEHMRPGS